MSSPRPEGTAPGREPALLYIPPAADPGPYRSLERVAASTRTALARSFRLIELAASPVRDPARFLLELGAVRGELGAVFDSNALAVTGPAAPELPVLFWALGSLPRGGGVLSIRRKFLKTTDAVLCNSTADLTILERMLGDTGPAGELVPFAVDTERFHPASADLRRAIRHGLGLEDGAFVLVFAGRLNVQKNVHVLLDLVASLAPQLPEVVLLLAGSEDTIPLKVFGVSNQGYAESLRARAERLGIASRVRFLGALDDARLVELLQAADLFVSLSIHHDENFGYAPVEAMAAGLPAVVTDWGGYRDSVAHGETGFRVPVWLTDNGVRAAVARAVPHVLALARDPALARRLAAAARARAVTLYSAGAFERGLAAAVRRAFARRGAPATSGERAFRFHPMALKLQARNALKQLARERAGERLDRRFTAAEGDIYRFFIAPYASGDVAGIEASSGDRPVPLVPLERAADGRLRSLDPIWPDTLELSAEHAAVLLADDPGTIAERARARGLEAGPELLADATRLARRGIIDLGRPWPAGQAPGPA